MPPDDTPRSGDAAVAASLPPPGAYADDELVALYDLVWGARGDDLTLYEMFARRGETPSLELGVGTGRVALHLARQGFDIVGIDTAKAMLARFEALLDIDTARHVRLVEADMRDFGLGERFDLVYCAANTFQHLLSTDEQLAALGCVGRHLTPGGVFVAEMRAPAALDWSLERTPLQLRTIRDDPATGEQVMQTFAVAATPATQTTTTTYIFDRIAADGSVRRRLFDVTLRYTGQPEMRLLLERAGLRLTQTYASADLSPFTDDSDTMVIVASLEQG